MNKYIFTDCEGWIFSIFAENKSKAYQIAHEDGYTGITCINM